MKDKMVFRPIWEMELIISGAIIIGLFQLPQYADQTFESIVPHISRQAFWLPFFIYYLAKLAINSLIGAFLVHFAIRSLWVAVLGLREIYPDPIDLDDTDISPVAKKFIQSRRYDLSGLQQKLDHFASLIFSVLFMVVIMLVFFGVWIVAAAGIAFLLRSIGLTTPFATLFLTILAILYITSTLISTFTTIVDKWFSKNPARLTHYPKLKKVIEKCYFINHYFFLYFVMQPLQPVSIALRSRVSGLRFTLIAIILCFIIIAPFIISMKIKTSNFDSYIYIPVDSVPQLLDTACYDTLRQESDSFEKPSIQSDIINGDGEPIRLFIPFYARNNNKLLKQLCPNLEAFHHDGWYDSSFIEDSPLQQRIQMSMDVMECTKKLYHISLDEQPVQDSDMLFAQHPQTRKKGHILYISTTNIPSGLHTLEIAIKRLNKKQKIEDETYFIPFWLEKK